MSTFTLYRDVADLLTIVREDGTGWPGAYWSTGLFVTDAWALGRRRKTELCRSTAAWARRLEWPEPIASWSRATGELSILEDAPGQRAERYLGMVYDRERWARLAPDAFAAAIRATATCGLTSETAAQAIAGAEQHQLTRLTPTEMRSLQEHADPRVRQAASRIKAQLGTRAAVR